MTARHIAHRQKLPPSFPIARSLTILAFVLCGLIVPRTLAADAPRPNIVLIFSDDHAFQAISAYGDPRKLLATPNIDRLAQRGCGSIAAW